MSKQPTAGRSKRTEIDGISKGVHGGGLSRIPVTMEGTVRAKPLEAWRGIWFDGAQRTVMRRRVLQRLIFSSVAVVGVLCGAVAHSETLWNKVKRGAENTGGAIEGGLTSTGKAIESGANSVGGAIAKGVDAVGATVSSTTELLSDEETPEQTRARLDQMAQDILARLLKENAQAQDLYSKSAGYAAFDSRKVTIFPITTGYGRGVAIAQETGQKTYMNMAAGGVGAAVGIGGFATQFVVMFETDADFQHFVTKGYDATAGAGAMAGQDSDEQTVRFVKGHSIFVLEKTGWRVNADAVGTKYWTSSELN